jgi:UDP-N-acetylglucosamine diphosphorylase / glucose-1-phosphate thymidylyltransferase / UDP-N-acetylgalactosamine diphosphorylase / glucosamine-1-phosphate N-acetyltransferase / galactosamine-1-phosphate N-acetyltransferase
MLKLLSYDKKEDDYKDLERSVNIDEAIGSGVCYMIHGNVLPTKALVKAILRLENGQFIATEAGNGIAYKITKDEINDRYKIKIGKAIQTKSPIITIHYPWNIFQLNDWAIREDFDLLTAKRKSQPISSTNKVIKRPQVFLEKGAKVEHCIINASTGPVYIGKNAEIMEGSIIRGPFAIGENSVLKLGTKIYGATSLGPCCVVGGEIKNSIFFGYSNKSHEGYIGDSVIGEWCNLGAGTTNSNIKNNAGEVRIWTPSGELSAGKRCGVLMGDHSRTAINTSINTGTVIGVSCNVFGQGLTPKYIPNFSWGSEGVKRYEFKKAMEDIEEWKKLKGRLVSNDEKSILKYVYEKF